MEDYFDNFEDDFDNDGFMDEGKFEDEIMDDMDSLDEDCTDDSATVEQESDDSDDFTAKDAFYLGGAMGWAYEEGLRERKRRKRKRFGDDSD